MDWNRVLHHAQANTLYEFLLSIPKSQWFERDPSDGETFLHFATRGHNQKAAVLLIKNGLDVNLCSTNGCTAAHLAARYDKPRVIELLCAANANMHTKSNSDFTVLNYLDHLLDPDSNCFRILIANGMRVKETQGARLVFQCGVLNARRAVVAMLYLFKTYKTILSRIGCKYMMKELAVAIWTTRCEEEWQN